MLDKRLANGYITVYQPIAGWKAVMYTPDPDCGGEFTPWQTGFSAFPTKAQAVRDARSWAEADEVPLYVDGVVEEPWRG